MTGKRLTGFIAVVGLGLGLAGSSAAAPITWAFEGEVGSTWAETPETLAELSSLGVEPGSSFYGQIVFESDTPDEVTDPGTGQYSGAISLFEVTIGSYHEAVSTFGTDNGFSVSRYDPEIPNYGSVSALANGPGSGAIFDGPYLILQLPGGAPGGIGSDALPMFPPDLVSYFFEEFYVSGFDAVILGDLTRIVRVPEPALGALLAFSLAAAGVLRSRSS